MTAQNLDRALPLEAGEDENAEEEPWRVAVIAVPVEACDAVALHRPPRKAAHPRGSACSQHQSRSNEKALAEHFGEGEDVPALLAELQGVYAGRGVNLVKVAGKWAFRTADDLAFLLERQAIEQRRLSRAALETLAIIAYHQPVTRAEIEEIRGVSTSKGTLDVLLETGWIKLRGRRRAPGRPVTYGTTEQFLTHFGFDQIQDLPGLTELKGAGLLNSTLPPGFSMPNPSDAPDLREDEDPLEDEPALEDAERMERRRLPAAERDD